MLDELEAGQQAIKDLEEHLCPGLLALFENPTNASTRALVAMVISRHSGADLRYLLKTLDDFCMASAENKMLRAEVYGLKRANADLGLQVASLQTRVNSFTQTILDQ